MTKETLDSKVEFRGGKEEVKILLETLSKLPLEIIDIKVGTGLAKYLLASIENGLQTTISALSDHKIIYVSLPDGASKVYFDSDLKFISFRYQESIYRIKFWI